MYQAHIDLCSMQGFVDVWPVFFQLRFISILSLIFKDRAESQGIIVRGFILPIFERLADADLTIPLTI